MKKVLSTTLYIVVAVAIALGFKFYNRSEASSEVKAQAVVVLCTIPEYERDEAYYQSLLDDAHSEAFEKAYDMGGRHRAASFDSDRYLNELFTLMAEQAKNDKRDRVAMALTGHRQALFQNQEMHHQ